MTRKYFISELYWLIHHGMLLEPTLEPISRRRRYIRNRKPRLQRAIRLRWLKPVKRVDLLPAPIRNKYRRMVAECKRMKWVPSNKYRCPSAAFYRLHDDLWNACNNPKHWNRLVKRHKVEYPGCPYDYRDYTYQELIFPKH